MTNINDMAMPQISIGVMEIDLGDGQVTDQMMLEIQTASTSYTCALATRDNYRQVADKLAEGIRRAGADMKAPRTKLITSVRELPDGIRRSKP